MDGLNSIAHEGKVYVDLEQLLDVLLSTAEQSGAVAIATNNEYLAAATKGLAEVLLVLEKVHATLFVQHGLTPPE
jgi:hypothetical protein